LQEAAVWTHAVFYREAARWAAVSVVGDVRSGYVLLERGLSVAVVCPIAGRE
jgi:hypothetical protein